MDLTTPALLFPAISLLLLAYTSRFLTLAQIIRGLHERRIDDPKPSESLIGQIKNLRVRLKIIKYMQVLGVTSFLLCTLSMFCLFIDQDILGMWTFGSSLLLLASSLILSLIEVSISTEALKLHLDSMG